MSNGDRDRADGPKSRIAASRAPVDYQQKKDMIDILAKATEEIRLLKGTP
jgi:hypothetical protein